MQRRFGEAGRRRVEEKFSWTAIAAQTIDLYRSLQSAAREKEPALSRVV
jgi:starch synthase